MPKKPARPRTDLPQLKFRGGWAPADLFHLIRQREITSLEFVLMLQIDALVESDGPGCYASNRYFGEILQVAPRHVQRLLHKLRKQGLVNWRMKDRTRFLETSWSRVKEARWTGTGVQEGGDIDVTGGGHRCHPIKDRNRNKTQGQGRAAEPPLPTPEVRKKKATNPTVPVQPASPPGEEQCQMFDHAASKPRRELDKVHLHLAETLHAYFKAAGRYPGKYSPTTWARELRSVADVEGVDKVQTVLTYLATSHQSAWPTIRNLTEFLQRYADLRRLVEEKTKPGTDLPAVQTIVRKSEEFVPPQGHADLPAVAAASLTNVVALRKALPPLIEAQKPRERVPGKSKVFNAGERYYRVDVLEYLLHRTADPETLVLNWLHHVTEQFRGWKGWSGRWKAHAFHLDHKDMPAFWEKHFQMDPKHLDRLRKEVGV
jgi:hypothetical protein